MPRENLAAHERKRHPSKNRKRAGSVNPCREFEAPQALPGKRRLNGTDDERESGNKGGEKNRLLAEDDRNPGHVEKAAEKASSAEDKKKQVAQT